MKVKLTSSALLCLVLVSSGCTKEEKILVTVEEVRLLTSTLNVRENNNDGHPIAGAVLGGHVGGLSGAIAGAMIGSEIGKDISTIPQTKTVASRCQFTAQLADNRLFLSFVYFDGYSVGNCFILRKSDKIWLLKKTYWDKSSKLWYLNYPGETIPQ